jgi:hypothetical protein
MKISKRVGYLAGLIVVVGFAGCSGPKPEPVYADIPSASGSPAGSEAPETGAAPAATTSETTSGVAATSEPQPSGAAPELIVTPDDSLTGTVVSVNDVGRFVVLTFPLGKMPAEGTPLFVYRQGSRVADLTVTGPQKDDHTVADIKSGECLPRDEVRDR